MLLREDGDAVIAIGQPAHAWVSGQLARSWGNERFGRVEPYEDVCLGAEQHDIGMAIWDSSPTLNPASGRPHSFMEMSLETHLELWSEAPSRMVSQSRYAALLISLHGASLYERRDPRRLTPTQTDAVKRFLVTQHSLQTQLIDQLRSDPARAASSTPTLLRRNRRLVFAWDFLSLALCLRWAPTEIAVPAARRTERLCLREDDGSFTLDPWPFTPQQVELHCEGRRLEGRFVDEQRMRAALESAPWMTLRFKLRAPSPATQKGQES